MSSKHDYIFASLIREVCKKCFGHELPAPLNEPESKHLASEILEHTGLVIGWKTLKNYSIYVLDDNSDKKENPSVATLDTLARYIAGAPRTDEASRKKTAAHFPYWYDYQHQLIRQNQDTPLPVDSTNSRSRKSIYGLLALALLAVAVVSFFVFRNARSISTDEVEEFNLPTPAYFHQHDWILKDGEQDFWKKQDSIQGNLTLFTHRGDNYPDSTGRTGIQNLLLHPLPEDCFTAELQLTHFIPNENWQQAGLLLLEDSNYSGKSLRVSIGYNDFFGGYTKPGEIIVQVIASSEGNKIKPEEVAQLTLFSFSKNTDKIVTDNMHQSGLRIEKNGHHFRFLYTTGNREIFAYKEITSKDISIDPKYIGIYASSGSNGKASIIPVTIDKFIIHADCQR